MKPKTESECVADATRKIIAQLSPSAVCATCVRWELKSQGAQIGWCSLFLKYTNFSHGSKCTGHQGDRCVHGHISPPECLACVILERDTLSEAFRRVLDEKKLMTTCLQQTIDNTRRELKETEDDLEKLCLELLAGINALGSLLIEHHSLSCGHCGESDDLVCNVCASKNGRKLWKEADEAKEKWHRRDKEKYGKAF